ncbi:MAG: hypothetical protein RIQ52_1286 [Pseudomonadota bacterium]
MSGQFLALPLALLLTVLLVRLLFQPAIRMGLIDHPGGRRQHSHPTPLIGGVCIGLTLLLVQLLLPQHAPQHGGLWLATLLLTLASGVLDDYREQSWRVKFGGQFLIAGLIALGSGLHVTHLGNLLGLGEVGMPAVVAPVFTIVAIVGLINAVNMVDGVDGLLGSILLPPLGCFLLLSLQSADAASSLELMALIGAIMGFFVFNLRHPFRQRACIFMGDAGSLLLGWVLAVMAIRHGGSEQALVRPITVVWLVAYPLLEVGSMMLLRIRQGVSPFHADRQHWHYVLLDAGYSVNQVVCLCFLASMGLGLAGLSAEYLHLPEVVMFAGFILLWLLNLYGLKRPQKLTVWLRRHLPPHPY